jgi:transcriptional regulator with XRE-family HTH domain
MDGTDGTTRPARTTGAGNPTAAVAVDGTAELTSMIRALAQRTGRNTQGRQAEALGISDTTLSAYLHGRIPPEKTLLKMLDRASIPAAEHRLYLAARQRASRTFPRPSTAGPGPDRMTDAASTTAPAAAPPTMTRQRRAVPAGLPGRIGLAVAAVVAALALIFTLVRLWPDRTPAEPSAAGMQPPAANGVQGCDRYRIDAETLGLRTADGELTGEELTRGTAVTVLRRSGPAGRSYWYVASNDRRRVGWVLPSENWWHPTC